MIHSEESCFLSCFLSSEEEELNKERLCDTRSAQPIARITFLRENVAFGTSGHAKIRQNTFVKSGKYLYKVEEKSSTRI